MTDTGPRFISPAAWEPTSDDPNDQQFGDVVETVSLSAADGYDIVLVGEPYDGAVIGRRGAADGPTAIRESLAGAKTNHFGLRGDSEGDDFVASTEDDSVASTEGLTPSTLADLGDVDLPDGDTATVQRAVEAAAEAVYDTGTLPVFLGGDNSLTVGNVKPLVAAAAQTGETVGVVNFDAHLDVREPRNGPTSGTPYRQLLEAGLDGYTVVGARHFETSTAYADYVAEQGGTVITADTVESGIGPTRTRIAEATADLDALYVSVDLDVLDAAAAPGVSAPTPGGLTTRELFELVRALGGDERVAGFELVETAPSLDPAAAPESPERNRSVIAAARTVAHFLAGVAERGAR